MKGFDEEYALGYAMIEALGQVEDKYVEEAARGGFFRRSYKIAAIAAACLLLMVVPSATVLASDYFSSLKGDELAFGRVEYQGEGVVSIQVYNDSDKTLEFQKDVKLGIFYANQEIPRIDGGRVEMEGNVVAPHSTSELLVDLSGAYDMAIADQPLKDDWYYLVLTNDHFVFGQDWQCPVDFQKPVEESVIYGSGEREEPQARRELEMNAFVYEEWTQPVERMSLSVFFGTQGSGSFSDHINIAGEKGDDVFAVEDGTVVEAGFEDKCGNYVVLLLQDDVKVKYGHLQDVYVAEDQEVEKGSVIGTVGQSGIATGPNLSLTLYVKGEAVNPLKENAAE